MNKLVKLLFFQIILLYSHCAVGSKKLLIYTCSSFSPVLINIMKKEFLEKHDCNLKFIYMSDSMSLLNKMRIEKNNIKADIIFGLDGNLMYLAEQTQLLINSNIDVRSKKLLLPINWDSKIFIPIDYSWITIVYNKNKIKKLPSNFKFLIEKKLHSIIYPDPRISITGFNLLLWIERIYGNNASIAWKHLSKKTVFITRSWSEAYTLFLKGESDMVLSYNTSPVYHKMIEKKDNFSAALVDEGHCLQVNVAAIVKNTKNIKLCYSLLEFILSKSFQKSIPTNNWTYPSVNVSLPKEFDIVKIPKKTFCLASREDICNRLKWITTWYYSIR